MVYISMSYWFCTMLTEPLRSGLQQIRAFREAFFMHSGSSLIVLLPGMVSKFFISFVGGIQYFIICQVTCTKMKQLALLQQFVKPLFPNWVYLEGFLLNISQSWQCCQPGRFPRNHPGGSPSLRSPVPQPQVLLLKFRS